MLRYCFALLLCVSFLSGVAQKKKQEKQTVLFEIGKNPTYTDEFIYLYKKNHTKPEDFTKSKIDDYLTLFVNFKLKITEAHNRGMDTTAKFNKELKTYREDLKKPYRAEADVLDKLTREAYSHLTEEVKASHILIMVKPDAFPADTLAAYTKIADIRKRIIGGEDFTKLASELSEDPSAKSNGGNLGYFTAMQMVYPFEQAAFNTKVGDVSPIIRTRFGYHIIKVADRKPARGEVEVSHILLRTGTGDDAKVKNSIFEIYDQLKAGRNWDELCKEHSEDTNTKNLGGRLRPFGVGALASVPEFEATAFALQKPGDISDPFKSSVGWHIIRLEKKIPIPPYGELEASLKKRVARDERVQISQQALIAKRRKDYAFLEDASIKKQILALADSSLIKAKWKYAGTPELLKAKPFSIQGKPTTTAEFVHYIKMNQSPVSLNPQVQMNQLYDRFAEDKIGEAEEEKLKQEHPEYKSLLNEYREGILLFEIMETEVWNKASEDTAGQHKYYRDHIDKYKGGDRVEARIFSTPDKDFLQAIMKKISVGDTLKEADVKKFKSIQNFRNYEHGESKVVDKVSWSIGPHELELDKVFYLVEIKRLVAPGTKSFEEAHATVISDYQDFLEKDWVVKLRSKYPVKINSKGQKMVVTELQKK